ncbi:MAG: tryptophan-rich sensory protein [Anaerolineae bacterium]|nr:tryptophan-rich sensory protein [Anaerolineae bacterium]
MRAMMNRDVLRQFVNIVALVATVIVNGLSQGLPLNGQTPAQISNRLPILFVPDNYVFSIWGLIYTLLIGFVVYQALPSQRENPTFRKIGYWFALSCAANIGWIFLFHWNQFGWSVLAMLALLGSLLMIYMRIGIGVTAVRGAMRWWVHTAFSVYLGWITVATVANIAYALFDAGWNGFGISGEVWTVVMLIVATGITGFMVLMRRDWAYSAVIIWALIGIVVKQAGTPVVATTAGIMVAAVLAALAARFLLNRPQGGAGKLTGAAA